MFMRLTLVAAVVLLASCSTEKISTVEPQSTPSETPVQVDSTEPAVAVVAPVIDEKAAQAEYDALDARFQAAVQELKEKVAKAESKDRQAELLAMENPSSKFAIEFLELAKKHKGTKASVDATLFAVGQSKGETKNDAMTFLLTEFPDKVKLSRIAASLKQEVPHPAMENWFVLMIKNAGSDKDKASVMLSYAQYIGQFPTFKRTLEINPQVSQRLPKAQLDYINETRTAKQQTQLEFVLNSLINDFGDLIYQGRKTYGQVATSELFELTKLQVGMKAPEVIGEDLDEIPFKLSDYRGKVVMLDFWGHWCPPCRAMYGHEQDITRSLADKPFVLLGVNSDADKDTAVDAVRSESLSWRHFWNGSKGTRGPISTQWNVEGWPTVYLIDGDGIIRYKEVLGDDIDRGIEILMAEMGHKVSLHGDRAKETVSAE